VCGFEVAETVDETVGDAGRMKATDGGTIDS